MPHLARIVIIAFALVATSCSAERAQQDLERKEKDIGQQLTAAYDSCVRMSFASMLPTMVDRNSGIDQAFRVCRTEESKLQAFEESLSGNSNSAAVMAAHRNTLKESCGDSSGPPDRPPTAKNRPARLRYTEIGRGSPCRPPCLLT